MYYVQPWELHEHLLLRNFGVMIWIDLYTKIYHSDYSAEFVHKHTSFLLNLFYNLYWSWNFTTIDQRRNENQSYLNLFSIFYFDDNVFCLQLVSNFILMSRKQWIFSYLWLAIVGSCKKLRWLPSEINTRFVCSIKHFSCFKVH